MNKPIPTYSIKALFKSADKYIIPIYQRNYAWGEPQITQLVQDIFDYATKETESYKAYYIGTLVVYDRILENETIYETIDGQQRLTTLSLLISALKRLNYKADIENNMQLSFDSRKKSTDTLSVILSENKSLQFVETVNYNENIQQGYYFVEKALNKIVKGKDKTVFVNYLLNNVKVVRVSVPEETNLNHYFEIMNNRGEQLEKHEVLKASMLEVVKANKPLSNAFNQIWEACADMERYVQYGFTTDQRSLIFGSENWNNLTCNSLNEISDIIEQSSDSKNTNNEFTSTNDEYKISEIIKFNGSFDANTDHKEDAPERFNSVINFPNFLLHVLRIQTNNDITLDDKSLLDSFPKSLLTQDFVSEFGFNLLKIKFLFDKYIIKREFIKDNDQWSLKHLKWYNGNKISYINTFGEIEDTDSTNKEIIILLSMFHVSAPTLVYKHWLNASLKFIFQNNMISSNEYRDYLKKLAQTFLFDRYITNTPINYYEIIYSNGANTINKLTENYDLDLLDKGTLVENFVFNYLDYILWAKKTDGYKGFEFTFRSSVEHYYPQNPVGNVKKINERVCDSFGNLCLISRSKNSKLSNHLPEAKKQFYTKSKIDSLKQKLMMETDWNESEIKKHGKEMKDYLVKF